MMNIDEITNRLKILLNLDSDKKLAERLEISQQDYSNRKRRGSLLPLVLEYAVNNNVNISTLLGEDKLLSSNHDEIDDFSFVPMAEARLSAGGGSIVISEEIKNFYAFRTEWLRHTVSALKNVVLMQVEGDSMFSTIHDHDVVLIDMGRKHIQGGHIYALGIDDTIMIKRLDPIVGGKCRIISDNKEVYPAYETDLQDIRTIGQVIWFARELICK